MRMGGETILRASITDGGPEFGRRPREPCQVFYADRPDILVAKGWDLHEYPSLTVRS
jgi:hypothetical protein